MYVFLFDPGYKYARGAYHLFKVNEYGWTKNGPNPKTSVMNLDETIKEMEGKINLLDNKKFIFCAGAIGIYYLAFLGLLTHIVIRNGGFH
jgi:hypothetical protein